MRSIALTLVLSIWVAAMPARAVAEAVGTDIVFLIDQSGSMMGKGATRTKNDPEGKRIRIIKDLADYLTTSAAAGYTNRISVVEFGGRNANHSKSRPQVTLHRALIPPVGPNQYPREIWELIDRRLSPLRPLYRGDTDIGAALALARDEIQAFKSSAPAVATGGKPGERNRVLVLITDGAPYYANRPKLRPDQYKAEIGRINDELSTDDQLFMFAVFGFNDASRYWQSGWGNFWEKIASKDPKSRSKLAFLMDRDADVKKTILPVLTELIRPGIQTTIDSDIYTAPPYLKELVFNIDFSKPNATEDPAWVNIRDPNGNRLVPRQVDRDGARLRVADPLPGDWRLRDTGDPPYRVQVQPIYEQISLVQPPGVVPQFSEHQIRFRVEGRGSKGLFEPQNNLPEVRFELALETPTGNRKTLVLGYDSQKWEAITPQPYRFEEAGRYKTRFTGVVATAAGTDVEVFAGDVIVEVSEAIPFKAHFVRPAEGIELALYQGSAEIATEIRFRDARSGDSLTANEVLRPGAELRIGIHPEGMDEVEAGDLSDPVPLTPTGEALTAQVPLDFGHTRWDLLIEPLGVRLLLEPGSDPWRQDVRYLGVAGSGEYRLGPRFQVRESLWSLWPWALGILLLLPVLWAIWRFLVVCWLIKRSDRKYQRQPRLTYAVPRDASRGKEWNLKGVCTLKPSPQVVLAEGEPWNIRNFRIRRLRRSGKESAIEVTYRPFNQEKEKEKRREKILLEAHNDDGAPPHARKPIKGLPDNQAADFVLFVGGQRA